jgi:hypothetical protein
MTKVRKDLEEGGQSKSTEDSQDYLFQPRTSPILAPNGSFLMVSQVFWNIPPRS